MEKKKSSKLKTVAELEAKIAKLTAQRDQRIQQDRIEIGKALQEATGMATLEEMQPIIAATVRMIKERTAAPQQVSRQD